MKVLGVREFKASLGDLIQNGEAILITSRGRPVGWFKPLKSEDLKQVQKEFGLRLVGLGDGTRGKVSEHHDQVLYE
ncbi:type II toxin-antitoxin system Phd/YefM family antitoxin [Candidatus Acetothermia bacterium]|nr:type II toxin-antitoxin system Phd/YefM family antitoxin [Candidatus Acetothermia bacterium]